MDAGWNRAERTTACYHLASDSPTAVFYCCFVRTSMESGMSLFCLYDGSQRSGIIMIRYSRLRVIKNEKIQCGDLVNYFFTLFCYYGFHFCFHRLLGTAILLIINDVLTT